MKGMFILKESESGGKSVVDCHEDRMRGGDAREFDISGKFSLVFHSFIKLKV